ncbi:hypothetical protein DFH11DRAFT_1664210 [Phellopilus nigrolimitatus]|nr:hypothetical protein DFH11DRAFT_1664210 [Phellopilus nigrolimitatus]
MSSSFPKVSRCPIQNVGPTIVAHFIRYIVYAIFIFIWKNSCACAASSFFQGCILGCLKRRCSTKNDFGFSKNSPVSIGAGSGRAWHTLGSVLLINVLLAAQMACPSFVLLLAF